MSEFAIYELGLGVGKLAISPIPGRAGDYAADLVCLLDWGPDLVVTMTLQSELEAKGAATLAADLASAGIVWHHLPTPDYGTMTPQTARDWPGVSATALVHLGRGGKVLIHCHGGCGRSGMVALRLMIDAGVAPDLALTQLRAVRPCAVETPAQMAWAMAGPSDR